jgi:hypothetical protein
MDPRPCCLWRVDFSWLILYSKEETAYPFKSPKEKYHRVMRPYAFDISCLS